MRLVRLLLLLCLKQTHSSSFLFDENDDGEDENESPSSSSSLMIDEEEEEEEETEERVVFTFNLTSTMEWSVSPGNHILNFDQESCKERSELDFDNLISGTARRDGIWTSDGKFISADAESRCPIDGTCFDEASAEQYYAEMPDCACGLCVSEYDDKVYPEVMTQTECIDNRDINREYQSRISIENINREYQSRISIENINREYQSRISITRIILKHQHSNTKQVHNDAWVKATSLFRKKNLPIARQCGLWTRLWPWPDPKGVAEAVNSFSKQQQRRDKYCSASKSAASLVEDTRCRGDIRTYSKNLFDIAVSDRCDRSYVCVHLYLFTCN